jgi:SHS family lactate transporter-like MFS transporter
LNELSPDGIRGTFPGFTYQLGNLLASANATLQAGLAQSQNGDYAFALAAFTAVVAVAVALLAAFGPEFKEIEFGRSRGNDARLAPGS